MLACQRQSGSIYGLGAIIYTFKEDLVAIKTRRGMQI